MTTTTAFRIRIALLLLSAGTLLSLVSLAIPAEEPGAAESFGRDVRPLLQRYCLDCHSTKAKKGSLDLERFGSEADLRKDLKPWQNLIEQIEAGEMPPKSRPQPTAMEKKHLLTWVRGFLDAEARARAGDPGHVPLRRLSNAEYDATIRALTGVDLRPTREFPADGAAGEGFTNAAEALTDISPTLLNKYLNAAREIARHAVLVPDGFRFSPSTTRRDWTDESTARLRAFYAPFAGADGRLPFQPYLAATVRHRDALVAGTLTPEAVATKEKLNPKYLAILYRTLIDRTPSEPLDTIRARWRTATEKDVPALVAEVTAWQTALWKTVKIGNYIQANWHARGGFIESLTRQVPVDPPPAASVPLRVPVKLTPGQTEVTIHLAARDLGKPGSIVWHRPRFEGPGKPALLLRDYATFGPTFEADYPSAFVGSAKYLAAAVTLANDPKTSVETLARQQDLDTAFLRQWVKLLAVAPRAKPDQASRPAVALAPLDEKTRPDPRRPAITGWRRKGTDLPAVLANSSDRTEQIPGRVSAHGVSIHPTPQEFVAVTWKSPLAGKVRINVRVSHAHPACGNGVAWWLEQRQGDRATLLDEGQLDLGKEAKPPAMTVTVEKGDLLVLAVEPRAANHFCDMTEVAFVVTENDRPSRVWDLAADVSASIHAGNPHADRHGHADTWAFARGPASKEGAPVPIIPVASILGRWRLAAADPARIAEAEKLAKQVEAILSAPRPADPKSPDRPLHDRLVAVDSPLFAGVDVARLTRPRPMTTAYGLPRERFVGDGLVSRVDEPVAIRLPAALFAGRQFVVDARLDRTADRLVRVHAADAPPGPDTRWAGPLLGSADGAAHKTLVAGHDAFRRVFPLYVCFPHVVPTDELLTIKMFHREDEPLIRLFLTPEDLRPLDHLWAEQRFISRQPAAEFAYLPQFMGFTTQDTTKAFQQFFIDRKPLFKKQADAFLAEEQAAIPKQLEALLEFAAKAYRRPLQEKERADLRELYSTLRDKGVSHDEAFRGVLARVLVAPAFLFRIEAAPAGKSPAPVNDWELAVRLSYFLWSSPPDDELRRLAAEGRLRDTEVLVAQARRMLKDDRLRSLAIEFGTQWIHVRGFDAFNEKNEKVFPTFDATLRAALYEEAIRFFQDLFQADRAVTDLLDADHTFLNETLAKHYGIPNVRGPEWRRVTGVRKYGRGGILTLGSVQAKQAGASRTSPILRGTWVVETLLGEKLPRPPANVPQLPESENVDGLTTRQIVERHTRNPSCATCHVRIDPYGFALERYDAIGRLRDRDQSGLAIDATAHLRDGTDFAGVDGLRTYLLTKKKDVVVRLFCQRLLGYALGRATTLSDQTLLDEMVAALNANDGRLSVAVLAVVKSPAFRMIRGADFTK